MIGMAALYGAGVIAGSLITTALFKFRLTSRMNVTESLVIETIGQYAYLQATIETVDEETESEIQQRAEEIADEYDVEIADVGGVIDG
ncbi:hypothetical protein [Natrinema halophilum]|uniref:hypothetical protein n=1 Tax=Natrinema halophilum TaxID=1699371 RepID=UPI001F31BFDB|nr:hypothetical protein [Natrinema halophilum]UHQ96411.1 hypothetical protein HYG82_23510 [Natrinema halophilum]